MDESQTLDALANVLNEISEKPQDLSLHLRHAELAKTVDDLESQLSAFQMLSEFLAAGDVVWLPLIDAKEKAVDLNARNGVEELLELYRRAEADYLSIPILQKHLQFVIEKHTHYQEEGRKPNELGDLFSTGWTRAAIEEIVEKGLVHLTKSCLLWDAQRDWELTMLEGAAASERASLIKRVAELHLNRLQQPHSNSDETFQSYSSFTTEYKPPAEYEPLMVAATKSRMHSVKGYNRRESLETSLAQSNQSLDAYAYYVGYERRAKYPDLFVTRGTYERAIAEAVKRQFRGEPGAEEALQAFWIGYCDAQRILNAGLDVEQETFKRALRSVPGSGEIWARYMRFLERARKAPNDLESVDDAYMGALNTKLIQSNMEQIIPVTLARAGYEKRNIHMEGTGEVATLIGVLETGIDMIHQASKTGDPKFRLEKLLAAVYEEEGLAEDAAEVWRVASGKYKSSYAVWINYTDALIKRNAYYDVRMVFSDVHAKQLDWPEAVWEAWISFEHSHGTVQDIDSALDKIEKAQYQTNARRAKEAERAAHQAAAEAQIVLPSVQAPVPMAVDPQAVIPSEDSSMDVDAHATQEPSKKRGAEDGSSVEPHKRARFEPNPPALKRDRENTTVFVADLPNGAKEEDLKSLFKDCGGVREVKITKLSNALVALVEFYERDSIPAALTKDKKRIYDKEIAVHLAWKSTLYVTNFPESADDAYMRNLFEEYGVLFDVRWPSKKFKNTRRFCYVQFTSPAAAERSLELHGRELEPNLPLNVYMSNPERKKDRTDQDANEREVYVAGLSRFTNKADLEKLFSTYGKVKDVRIATEQNGHAKGYAFIEFEEEKDAQRALDANNHELKKRRIAVTLADSRVRARHRSETGQSRVAETRSRSVRVRNLPPGTQEGLLQQVFEKFSSIRRVEVFVDKQEAVVELENTAEAGKLLLRTEPIVFNGNTLTLSEDGKDGALTRTAGPAPKAGGLFVPRRAAASRPRAGLGHTRAAVSSQAETGPSSSKGSTKGQDDFRKMLAGK